MSGRDNERRRAAGGGDLAAAAATLHRAGVAYRRIDAAGQAGDILAIDTDVSALARTRALAPELRGLGFRFVALDLAYARDEDESHDDGTTG